MSFFKFGKINKSQDIIKLSIKDDLQGVSGIELFINQILSEAFPSFFG